MRVWAVSGRPALALTSALCEQARHKAGGEIIDAIEIAEQGAFEPRFRQNALLKSPQVTSGHNR